MLDFLLVLGLVPGTDFQITFSEILFALAVFFLYLWERAHHKQVVRAARHINHRTRVNIRKIRRRGRWFVLRHIRAVSWAIHMARRRQLLRERRARRAMIWAITSRYHRIKRTIRLRIRRTKRAILANTIYRALRFKRRIQRSIRRTRRAILLAITKRYRRFNRLTARRLRRLKKTTRLAVSALSLF